MKVFIWVSVKKCSYNYHSKGGVVVVADDEKRARELANSKEGCDILEEEMPDETMDVVGGNEKVFIMPNAGCC